MTVREHIMEIKALDSYALKARYYPTVIVVAPICLLVLSLASGQLSLLKSLGVTVVSGLGLAFVMDQVGRDKGRSMQPTLFRKWGGAPATVLLRHQDTTLEAPTKARYHSALTELLPDLQLPSLQEEQEHADKADEIYASCVTYLREATRDHKQYPLVFQENSNYGFRRNLLGMRFGGITLSVLGTFACGGILFYRLYQGSASWLVPAILTLISAVLLYLWICRFNSLWVRTTAEAYARQLLAACDSLRQERKG